MQTTSFHSIRAAAFVVGIILSGAALAAPKDGSGSNDDKANCVTNAVVKFSMDKALCGASPPQTEDYGACMVNAVNAYTLALVACDTSAAALSSSGLSIGRPGKSQGSPSGDDNGKPIRISPVRLKAFGN